MAVVNEIFIVIFGTQWILCWTMLFATSYKPEGRSLPPSHWDNASLSDLWWDEVCVAQKGGSSESNPHRAILHQPFTGRPQRWQPDRKQHTGRRFVLQCSDSVRPRTTCERKQLQGMVRQILTSASTRLFDSPLNDNVFPLCSSHVSDRTETFLLTAQDKLGKG